MDALTEGLIALVVDHVRDHGPGEPAGLYLYGSVVTRLRPDSDIDLLLLTRRSLAADERAALIALLLTLSGWPGHAERFPEAAGRRPVELTSIVLDDLQPWREWPPRDFQYGEWLRAELMEGHVPGPAPDPDVVTLLATAHAAHRPLVGPPLGDLLDAVPPQLLHRSVLAAVPGLLDHLAGDERNALLTLARAVVTTRTGQIVPKDVAAERVAATLDRHESELLEYARAGYLGTVDDDWSDLAGQAAALARHLAGLARS